MFLIIHIHNNFNLVLNTIRIKINNTNFIKRVLDKKINFIFELNHQRQNLLEHRLVNVLC